MRASQKAPSNAARGATTASARSSVAQRAVGALVIVAVALAAWLWWRRSRPQPVAARTTEAAEPREVTHAPRARDVDRAAVVEPVAEPSPPEVIRFGTFEGRVISAADGRGVPGAVLTFERGGATSSAVTDAAGAFRFVPSHAGTHALMQIAAEGFVPFAPSVGQSPIAFVAAPGVSVRDVVFSLAAQVEVVVTVLDAAGRPAANAVVSRLETSDVAESALTDAAGEARLAVRPGALIDARRAPEAPARGRVDEAVARERRMTLHLGTPVDGAYPDLVSIAGRVVDPHGDPVEGAQIVARPLGSDAPQPFDGMLATRGRAVSEPDGRFEIRGLDDGMHQLTATAAGFAPARREVSTRDAHDIVLELRTGGHLAGTVRDGASGRGVQGFTVVVISRGAGARTESFFDAEGHYQVDGLAPGPHLVRVIANGYTPTRDVPAQLGDAGETATVDFTLTLGGRLRGRVVDARTRVPVAGARVALDGRPGAGESPLQSAWQSRSDANGNFELAGLPAGPQSVEVSAPGYHPRYVSGLRAANEVNADPVVMDLTPAEAGEQARTEVVGIGVTVSGGGGHLVVTSVMPGSGAAEAGISAGDQLVSVDGTALSDGDLGAAVQLIRGAEGTWVRIAFVRAADGTAQEREVPRRRVSFAR